MWQEGFVTLGVVAVLSSAVSAYYYLRVIKVMYFDAGEALDPRPTSLSVVLTGTGLFTVFFFAFPAPFMAAAQAAVLALLG